MALETNAHVMRLHRFQPFQPDSAELVYEQSDPGERRYETVALGHLASLVEDPAVKVVVLTGDAGHGKTSVCARLLEHLGMDAGQARNAIRAQGDGSVDVLNTRTGRPLRILKDLSDVIPERGAQVLDELLCLPAPAIAVVCANEGRLRRAVGISGSEATRAITRTLENGIADGSVSQADGSVHVLNLNYQSVAPDGRPGLVDWSLRTWAADRRSWQICARCDAQHVCPILANHRQLSVEAGGARRREAVRDIFATAERAGAVVTTRQALAIVAHAITGGVTCEDVHRRWQRAPVDRSWQHRHLFHQALFADRLSKEKRRQVPALRILRSLDPGHVAHRAVDDDLEAVADDTGFLPPAPASDDRTPRTRREAQRESEMLRDLMTFLRRRAFFDAEEGPSRMERMGFRAGAQFEEVSREGNGDNVAVRDSLLRGLEAVQGVHRAGEPPDFLVLDSAFFTDRSRAAVVALRLPSRNVGVFSHIAQWRSVGAGSPTLPFAMDWISRSTYLRLVVDNVAVPIELDLLRFELLYRWALGLSSRAQHEAEIRNLSAALARLTTARPQPSDDITVLVNGERRTLTIDVGERVRSGEG